MDFLVKTKALNLTLEEISSEIKVLNGEFDNVKLDYFVITLYGEFEKNLDYIIENKISLKNNFGLNYIDFIKNKDHKLHRGITKDQFKNLLEKVFNKKILSIVDNTEWNIFISFLEFRHAIAHSLPSYQQKKEALILQMRTQKNLLNVADKILKQLDSINRIKRVTA